MLKGASSVIATPPRGTLIGGRLRPWGLSKSKDRPFAGCHAICRGRLSKLAKTYASRDEFTLLAALGWVCLLRIKSEAFPTVESFRRKCWRWEGPFGEHVGVGASRLSLGTADGRWASSDKTPPTQTDGFEGDPQAMLLLRGSGLSRRRFAYTPTLVSSLLGLACFSGTSGSWGGFRPPVPVAQPHSASEMKRGQH